MMNPEIKQKWVDALRSGKYKQGTGALKTSDGRYCCLGVLCVVADEPMGDSPTVTERFAASVGLETNCGELPRPVRVGDDSYLFLTNLNDYAGLTFPQIADIIEEQL